MLKVTCKFLAIGLLGFCAAISGVLVGDRIPPVNNLVGVVVPTKLRAGEDAVVRWKTAVTRQCESSTVRELIDSKAHTHVLSTGAPWELEHSFAVPVDIPPGFSRYRAVVHFICNPLHQFFPIEVVSPEVLFEVIE